jgi:dTMP kinase
MNTGMLITFEGGEGGGKTTQVALLQTALEALGKTVVVAREPGGTTIGEQIRELVLSVKNLGIADTTEVLLFQAARAQIYHEVVLPALAAGNIVLMDRSRDSSVVYQGMVRGFGAELIEKLNTISTQNTYPSMTFLLDLAVDLGLSRKDQQGESNRLELEKNDFHQQVRTAYLELVQADTTGRWVVVDATQPLEQVAAAVLSAVRERLN